MGLFDNHACKGKEWKAVLKEWLNLLKLMKNPKLSYQSQFLKEVLQNRLTRTSVFFFGLGGVLFSSFISFNFICSLIICILHIGFSFGYFTVVSCSVSFCP